MITSPWLLVLGANSDMAIATAHRFAKAGYNLYLASRNLESLDKTAKDIHIRYGVDAKPLAFDALDFSSHQEFYDSLEFKPEGVVLAFGVMYEQQEAQAGFQLAKQMVDINYIGAMSVLEIVAVDFENRKTGFIVGISSVAGDRGRMSNYIYGSSKAALTTYLAGLRHRLSHSNVKVITVKPGFVATKMTAKLDLPAALTAQPSEVGKDIFNAVQKGNSTVYVKSVWRWIMLIICNLPNAVFHRTKL